MNSLILIGIGIVIGWHVPIPPWAKFAIDLAKVKFNEYLESKKTS